MEETVRVPIKREYRDFNAEEILGKLTNVKYATRQLLYEHYKSEDPETACSYATFCRRLEKLIKEKTPTQIYTNFCLLYTSVISKAKLDWENRLKRLADSF